MLHQRFDALVIGGGPAGSSAAIGLARGGMHVAVIEKKSFPRETVCGEFLSREAIDAIRTIGLYDEFMSLRPNRISEFVFVPENGDRIVQPLDFEAWSLKRSLLDQLLLRTAKISGAVVIQPADVTAVRRVPGKFEVVCSTRKGEWSVSATNVVAAYGKRNRLDKQLQRNFAFVRSGMTGLKYHVHRNLFTEFPERDIRIFAAAGIYCGVLRVTEDEATLCFLADSRSGRVHPNDALRTLLRKNRGFQVLFKGDLISGLSRCFPYGSGDIFFGKRRVVENGMYMVGDAAAVIAPLAGDGISMAIESGQMAAGVLLRAYRDSLDTGQTESLYNREWADHFKKRLVVASVLQKMAMTSLGGNLGGWLLKSCPLLAKEVIRRTRGQRRPLVMNPAKK